MNYKLLLPLLISAALLSCESTKKSKQTTDIPELHIRHGWAIFTGERPTKSIQMDKNSIARGKKLFVKNCAGCHGKDGKGNGPVAKLFQIKPANLTQLPEQTPNSFIQMQIQEGRGDMPKLKQLLTTNEAWDVTNYVRSLRKK